MKQATFGVIALAATGAAAQADHEVRGHTTSDGTYVAPHMQTNADATKLNNYAAQGNTNPYTGQAGTVTPYAAPANPYAPKKPY